MTKLATAIIATATVLYAASTSAQCPMHNYYILKGYDRGVVTYAGNPFIRTGGYKATAPAQPDIVDTAVAAGSFTTLAAALEAGGLIGTLKSEGPFTVFAPTDEAFAKLPAGTLESLLANKEQLVAVLKYHVVPGRLDARAVTSQSELPTAEGSTLSVTDIKIVDTDIMTSNGIIHVIDEVLIPAS